jgi:hypothetical protein
MNRFAFVVSLAVLLVSGVNAQNYPSGRVCGVDGSAIEILNSGKVLYYDRSGNQAGNGSYNINGYSGMVVLYMDNGESYDGKLYHTRGIASRIDIKRTIYSMANCNSGSYDEEETYNQEEVEECDYDCEENKKREEEQRVRKEEERNETDRFLGDCVSMKKLTGGGCVGGCFGRDGSINWNSMGDCKFDTNGTVKISHDRRTLKGTYTVTVGRKTENYIEKDIRLEMENGGVIAGYIRYVCRGVDNVVTEGFVEYVKLGDTEYKWKE